MNELQKKLARRRNLNGEGSAEAGTNGPEAPPTSSPSSTPTTAARKSISSAVPSSSTASKATKSFVPNEKPNSGATELQLKLARRANLNGEHEVAHRMSNAGQMQHLLEPDEGHKTETTPPTSASSSIQDPAGLAAAVEVRVLSDDKSHFEQTNTAHSENAEEIERLRMAAEEAIKAEAERIRAIEAEQQRAAAAAAEEEKRLRALEAEQQKIAAEAAAAAAAEEAERVRVAAAAEEAERVRVAAAETEARLRRETEAAEAAEKARAAEEEERLREAAAAEQEKRDKEEKEKVEEEAERQRTAAAAEAEAERIRAIEEEQEKQRQAAAAAAAVEAERLRAIEEQKRDAEKEAERLKVLEAEKQRAEQAAAAAAEAEAKRKQAELKVEKAAREAAEVKAREEAEKKAAEELKRFQELWAADTKAAEEEAAKKKESAAAAPTVTTSAEKSGSRAVSPMIVRQGSGNNLLGTGSAEPTTPASSSAARRAISTPGPVPSSAEKTPWYPGKYLLGSRGAKHTPLAMNPITAQSHYKEFLSTAGDAPMSPPATPHKTSAVPSSGSASAASAPSAPASSVTKSQSAVSSSTGSVGELHGLSPKEPEPSLELGVGGGVDVTGGREEHVILNNREIEALLAENSRLTALVKKLQAELDLRQAVIDAYEVTYAADPSTPAAAAPSSALKASAAGSTPTKASVTIASTASTPAALAPIAAPSSSELTPSSAASAPAPLAKSKSYKRHGYHYGGSGGYDEEEETSGGLFGDGEGTPLGGASAAAAADRRSKKFESMINDEPVAGAGGASDAADVDFDALLDTLSPSSSGASGAGGAGGAGGVSGAGSAGKYNPLQLASQDLVRSFVQGPSRPTGGAISAESMKEKLDSHGLFGAAGGSTAVFKEEATPAKPKPVEADHEMNYSEFITRFPRCLELVDMARRFLFSVIGPNGDGTPPPNKKKVDYIFYGSQNLDQRCRDFFDEMQRKFAAHAEFKNESEERILSARDCFEQYIMTRIAEFAFKGSEAKEDDERLARRMKLLSFLTPEALEIKAELFNETLLSIAADELRKINAFKTPGEKVACVVKSAGVIFRSLNLSRAKQDADKVAAAAAGDGSGPSSTSNASDNTPAGADDFLPLFIWVVMRSHIPKLFSNCEYIQAYLNPARLMGKSGYCLINLRSAIEFVMFIEAESLHIDAREFDSKLAAAEKELNGGF